MHGTPRNEIEALPHGSLASLTPTEVSGIVTAVFQRQRTGQAIGGFETALKLVTEYIHDFTWTKTTWGRDFKLFQEPVPADITFMLPRFRHGGNRKRAGGPMTHAPAKAARHGGKRVGAGRPTTHATAELARQANIAASSAVRKKRRDIENCTHPDRGDSGYMAYLVKPIVVDIARPCNEKGVNIRVLLDACKCAFANHHCHTDADEGGYIQDYYTPELRHTTTGQMRRVVNPSPQLARREFGNKHGRFVTNKLWIKSSFLDTKLKSSVSVSLKAIEEVAIMEIKSRYRTLGIPLDQGYPRLLEQELLFTPPDTPPQLAHADTRLNVVTVICSLTATEGRRHVGKSTFYAQNFQAVFDENRWDDMRKYTYTQFSLPSGVPSMTISHAAWPHHGPGNQSKTRGRYTLFMSFAMDEAATYFSTSEKVHRYTVSDTPFDETMQPIIT
jgi:hypothetical protein